MTMNRIVAGVFIALGLAVVFNAFGFYVPYQYEPLGPKAMPYLVGALLVLCGLRLLVVPSSASKASLAATPEIVPETESKVVPAAESVSSGWRQILCAGILLAYALSYESLGFVVATGFLGCSLAWLCGARLAWCFGVGVGLSLAGHLVLVAALGLQLPLGLLVGWR